MYTYIRTSAALFFLLGALALMLAAAPVHAQENDENGTSTATTTDENGTSTDESNDEESDDDSDSDSDDSNDAGTSSMEDMLEQIQELLALIQDLQERLNEIRGEVRELVRDGLEQGMSGDDVEAIQELLATDQQIYPEGLVTGYFGPLTSRAIARFQERFDLDVTGGMNDETKEAFEELLEERENGTVPPGLLRAPGIQKRVHERFENVCQRGIPAPFCRKYDFDDANDDEDEGNDDEDEFEVEVEVENGSTTVSFDFDGDSYEVNVDSTDESDVLDAVADELNIDVEDLDEDLEDEIIDELEDQLEDEAEDNANDDANDDSDDDSEDFDVEVEVENGSTTVSFDFDGDSYEVAVDSTDEDDVLGAIADELDVDVEDLDEDLADEIRDELEEELE